MGSVRRSILRPLDCLYKRENSVVLLLNTHFRWPLLWHKIWNGAAYRVCVDGAANVLESLVKRQKASLPHLLCGDFDSITDRSLKFFERSNVSIQQTPDQDSTDMWKALQIMSDEIEHKHIVVKRVIVLGGLSGRIDHTLSSFHSLLRFRSSFSWPIFVIDGINLVTVLTEGFTELSFEKQTACITRTAGYIPFCQKLTVVTSSGFKWDLKEAVLEFGGCISTSNRIEGDSVTIMTSAPLIFTLELSSEVAL